MKRMKLLFTLALPVLMLQNVQAKSGAERTSSTTTISRLVGIGDYVNNGAGFYVSDTTSLVYSNGRGGDLTHVMKYDSKNYFVYNNSDSLFDPSTQNTQVFDASNNISSNVLQGWGGLTIGWVPQTKNLYFYDVVNKTTGQIFQNWNTGSGVWVSSTKDDYTYTSTGQLFSDVYSLWNSLTTGFDASSEKIYSYDVNGNMLQELDNSNSGTSWVPVQEFVYTYNTANQPLTKTFDVWNGGAYVHNYRYSYSYDGASGNLVSTLYQTYNTDSASWVNVNLSLYSNFSGSNPQTQEDRTWNDTVSGGSWMPSMLWNFTYNSFAQMTSRMGTSYNVSLPGYENAAGDPMSFYHYETVDVNAVKNVTNNNLSVSVFPVPAQNMLHISLNGDAAVTYEIAIVDMAGRVVKSWKTAEAAAYTTTIQTDNMAAGNYFVKIVSANGQTTEQFSVVR